MTVSEKIQEARSKAGLTQQQLADAIGTTTQNISQYERGVRNPKVETLRKIADALEVPVTEFLDETLISMTTGERIRKARLRADMTQEQLANKLGICHNSISSWENGVNSISIETLKKIADALGVPVAEFLGMDSAAAGCEVSDRERLIGLLFQVVKQGAQEDADPEKVRILPETARLLAELIGEEEGGRK